MATIGITPELISQELDLSAEGLLRRLNLVGFEPEDARRMPALHALMEQNAQGLSSVFFEFLGKLPEAAALFGDRARLAEARLLKTAHLRAMVSGIYDTDYVRHRLRLALIYAEAGLEPRIFLGAYHSLQRDLGLIIMKHYEKDPVEGFQVFLSLNKIAFFDLGLIIDVLILGRERIIQSHEEAIRSLSRGQL